MHHISPGKYKTIWKNLVNEEFKLDTRSMTQFFKKEQKLTLIIDEKNGKETIRLGSHSYQKGVLESLLKMYNTDETLPDVKVSRAKINVQNIPNAHLMAFWNISPPRRDVILQEKRPFLRDEGQLSNTEVDIVKELVKKAVINANKKQPQVEQLVKQLNELKKLFSNDLYKLIDDVEEKEEENVEIWERERRLRVEIDKHRSILQLIGSIFSNLDVKVSQYEYNDTTRRFKIKNTPCYKESKGKIVPDGEVSYDNLLVVKALDRTCLLYTSPSPRD